MDSYEIIKKIANAKKKTPAKIYLQGDLDKINFGDLISTVNQSQEFFSVRYRV